MIFAFLSIGQAMKTVPERKPVPSVPFSSNSEACRSRVGSSKKLSRSPLCLLTFGRFALGAIISSARRFRLSMVIVVVEETKGRCRQTRSCC